MKLSLILLIITVLFYSCSSIKTENIKSSNKLKKYSFIYNLPKTDLVIKVKAQKKTYIPGPYSNYAKKYLGIELKNKTKQEVWQIFDVDIKEIPVIDSSKYFVVNYKGNKIIKSYNINDLGFLTSINNIKNSNKKHKNKINNSNNNLDFLPDYTNVIIKPIFVDKIDTSYKTVYRDSIARKVPVYKRTLVTKDKEKQAEDAAKFIIKIRKRRLRVLTGMDKEFPKGSAAKNIIEKLDELEQQYLELFVGKIKTEKREFSFRITPEKNKLIYDVCSYSKNNGFDKNTECNVKLILSEQSYNSVIDSFLTKNIKTKKVINGIYYRLPKTFKAQVNFDDEMLFSKNIQISQFGNLMVLDKSNLKNKSIIFSTVTGAIKSIK